MKMLQPPIEPWAMHRVSDRACRPPKDTDEHEDVCIGCQVDGGCNDKDVRCGLVAVRGTHADGRRATRTLSSESYREKLNAFRKEHGFVPFPEQERILAKGG